MALLAELCDPEDEDGFFPYTPFVDRLTGKSQINNEILYLNVTLQDIEFI